MPNGGGTKSRVGAALATAFPAAKMDVRETSSGVQFWVTSRGFSGMGSDQKRRSVLAALRGDAGGHLHGATIEHVQADQFRIVPPPAAAESQVVTIRLVAPRPATPL